MQNRFKFRAFLKRANLIKKCIGIYENNVILEDEIGQFSEPHSEVKIMQCTGLHDKNGNLIYEDDIIEYDRSDLCYGSEIIKGRIDVYKFEWAIMYYSPTCVNAITKKPSLQHLWLGCDDFLGSRTTILGNIHENPELINHTP